MKQVWYESKDKTRDPDVPVLQEGIETGRNESGVDDGLWRIRRERDAAFRDDAVIWVEHGGVFALPNLRGGGEFGEDVASRRDAREEAECVRRFFRGGGMADRESLYARGQTGDHRAQQRRIVDGRGDDAAAGSFRRDCVRLSAAGHGALSEISGGAVLGAGVWVVGDAAQFPALYAYSPYHHVVKGTKYPAVLFLTGDSDTRVAPLHARKMTAEMQAAQGGDKPILLLYDTKLGHSEGRPVSKIIEEDTQVLGFFFWQVGVKNFRV